MHYQGRKLEFKLSNNTNLSNCIEYVDNATNDLNSRVEKNYD